MARWSLFVLAFLALLAPCSFAGEQQGGEPAPHSASRSDRTTGVTQVLSIGGATIEVEIAAGSLDVPPSNILSWSERAARAVTIYYGQFPVQRVRFRGLPILARTTPFTVQRGEMWADSRESRACG